MWLIGLLLIWFAVSFVAALVFAACMRAGRGPDQPVSRPDVAASDHPSTRMAA